MWDQLSAIITNTVMVGILACGFGFLKFEDFFRFMTTNPANIIAMSGSDESVVSSLADWFSTWYQNKCEKKKYGRI